MLAFYAATLKRWPIPYETLIVPTRYGATHLSASGAPDALPLLLIRGVGGNALLWKSIVAQLSQHFRTYAVGVIGESGKSAPTRPSYQGRAYGEWLVDLLGCGLFVGVWLAYRAIFSLKSSPTPAM